MNEGVLCSKHLLEFYVLNEWKKWFVSQQCQNVFCHLYSSAICYGIFRTSEQHPFSRTATMFRLSMIQHKILLHCSLLARKEVRSLCVNKRRVQMSNACNKLERNRNKCTFRMHFSSPQVSRKTFREILLLCWMFAQLHKQVKLLRFLLILFAYFIMSFRCSLNKVCRWNHIEAERPTDGLNVSRLS